MSEEPKCTPRPRCPKLLPDGGECLYSAGHHADCFPYVPPDADLYYQLIRRLDDITSHSITMAGHLGLPDDQIYDLPDLEAAAAKLRDECNELKAECAKREWESEYGSVASMLGLNVPGARGFEDIRAALRIRQDEYDALKRDNADYQAATKQLARLCTLESDRALEALEEACKQRELQSDAMVCVQARGKTLKNQADRIDELVAQLTERDAQIEQLQRDLKEAQVYMTLSRPQYSPQCPPPATNDRGYQLGEQCRRFGCGGIISNYLGVLQCPVCHTTVEP